MSGAGVKTQEFAEITERLFTGEATAVADPYPLYERARHLGTVQEAPTAEGLMCTHVLGYAEAKAALRDPRLSSGILGGDSAGDNPLLQLMLVNLDPPDHTRVRRLVHKAFTPRTVELMRNRAEEMTRRLLDDSERSHRPDLVADLADPLPTQVIAALLGAPEADWDEFKRWSKGVMTLAPPPADSFERAREMAMYLFELVKQRRVEPKDDLISALVAARDRGEILSDFELVAQCVNLLVGGHETTTYTLGSSILALLRDGAAWQSLEGALQDPITGGRAVDELIRHEAAFQFVPRYALDDLEIGGQTIPEGRKVWVWVGSANHDPAQFTDPGQLDLQREPNPHLTFGHGGHTCIGSALAKLNLTSALSALRTRYPQLSVREADIVWRSDLGIRGPESLPVSFRPEGEPRDR